MDSYIRHMANKSKQNKTSKSKSTIPPQSQRQQPGRERLMNPKPEFIKENYQGSGKLVGKVALITGGDSGIGRAIAVSFAREGADVAVLYFHEPEDARYASELIKVEGGKCLLIKGDIGKKKFCESAIKKVISHSEQLDVLVNNVAEQHPEEDFLKISEDHLEKTFRTNIFSMFFLTQSALKFLKKSRSASIINTTSVTAYRGSLGLIDYLATKGAIVSFTRSLSQNLASHNIRVNAVAPDPIWTPLIPATFDTNKVKKFGSDIPLGRPGQPSECAPAYVYLASDDSSYVTGQTLHINVGEIING